MKAQTAYVALLIYVVLVYLNPGTLFFEGSDVGIAKIAAGIALGGIGLAWLLFDRPLTVGGATGLLLAGHFAIVGASAAWSLWPSMTIETFLDGLKYLAIFVVIVNVVDSPKRATLLLHVLALATLIPAIGTINSWAHGEHLVEDGRATWIGIFGNPNDLAYHLDVGMALALGGRELSSRRWLRLAYLGALAVMASALLLTQSRGGLIAAGAVFGLWGIRGLKRGRTLVGVAAMIALAIWIGPDATWQRAETTMSYKEDASAQGRIDAWRTGVNVLLGRPFTGVGAGAFPLAWPEFAPGDAGAPRTAHNTFVQVSAETGLPSFALFCGAIAVVVIGLGRAGGERIDREERERFSTVARSVQVGLGGFIVCSLTGGLAYSWPLYFLLGLGASLITMANPRAARTLAPLGSFRGPDRLMPAFPRSG